MTQKEITVPPLTLFAEGLKKHLLIGKTKYHACINPDSPSFDPDMPRTIPLGNSPNSPRAFLTHELAAYIELLVTRARGSTSYLEAGTAHAAKLVAARQSRRAAHQGE